VTQPAGDSGLPPGDGREPSVEELRAAAAHASRRVALYRRRIYAGGGEPRRLAELERISAGAAERLRRALRRP
jgi:hypothetical protein